MAYKWCVVPKCISTSIKTPEKLFVSIPKNPNVRKKWLELARRDPKGIKPNTNVFMCEDHFNMENDIINYMQYKMGLSKILRLADGVLPSKFDYQPDRKRGLADPSSSRQMDVIEKNISKRSVPKDVSEIEKMDLESAHGNIETLTQEECKTADQLLQIVGASAYEANMAKRKYYKCCIVPMCKNTSESTPNKLFLYVPKFKPIRDEWCRVIGRSALSDKTVRYCCEDHFNLEDDVENYMEHKIMNVMPRLKSGVLPTKLISKKSSGPPSSLEEHNKKNKIDEMPTTSYYILTEVGISPTSSHQLTDTHNFDTDILERSEIKIEVVECEIKEEVLQEDLIDTTYKLNEDTDDEIKNFNLINEDVKPFNTTSTETTSIDTKCNENLIDPEFIKCESTDDTDIYYYE